MKRSLFALSTAFLFGSAAYLPAIDFGSTLEIPPPESLQRIQTVDEERQLKVRNNFVSLKTEPAEAIGEGYFILTDHQESAYLNSLEKLRAHRHGTLLQVADLSSLYHNEQEREALKASLQGARYLAIAPRLASFRENTVLALFELLTELDDDPQIDVYPGFLVATEAGKLATIIENAINYQPLAAAKIQPVAISLVDSKQRIFSLQKAGYFRDFFKQRGKETPTFLVYLPRAHDAPSLGDDQLLWYQQLDQKKNIITELPAPFDDHFQQADLVIMHGHGTVGESCRIATRAMVHQDLSGKVILSGSCFSAAPENFDWPIQKKDHFEDSTSFSIKAMERGAVSSFGHMRLSNGFRYLHPLFEELYAGGSNGEAYHKLLNAIFVYRPEAASHRLTPVVVERKPMQNDLLYILFGDPALTPYLAPKS